MGKKDFKQQHKQQPKNIVKDTKVSSKKIFIYLAAILLLTLIVYSNSINNGYVPWDDNVHIYNNKDIRALDAAHLKKMFSKNDEYLYHPITILSFALDYKLWGHSLQTSASADEKYKIWNGMDPAPAHFENLLIHLLNVLLVFYLLFLITKKEFFAAIVALFFAIHPMHVEDVSWATGRKDVLFTLFYLGALIFYIKSKIQNSKFKIQNLIYCFVLFVLSLLSKPAAVTLPLIMMLVDYYYGEIKDVGTLIKSLAPKLPFFLLSVIFGLLPFIWHKGSATVDLSRHFNYFDRFFLINYSVFFYIFKLIFPFNLSTLHYYPLKGLPPEYFAAPVINIFIIIGVIISGKHKKTLIFGLLFFFLTIFLSLQFFPYGQAIVAERYTYLPYIGLLFIVGKFYTDIYENKLSYATKIKPAMTAVLVIAALLFSYLTFERNKVWKDGIVLFTDVIEKSPDVFYGYSARGDAKSDAKDYRGALEDFNKCIELQSNYADAHFSAGRMYYYLNNFKKSIDEYNKALEINPKYAEAYCNRAASYFTIGNYQGTLDDCTKAVELKPDYADAYVNRGNAKGILKDYAGSIQDFDKGITLNPNLAEAYRNRGISKLSLGRKDEACQDFRTANNLGIDMSELMKKNCN